jgi:L-lactate utilization protein LutB
MSTDYLANLREKSLGDASNVSEPELHASSESIKEGWQTIQDLKRKIATAKQEAIKKIDEQFAEELKDAEENYAFLLTLTR